MIQFHWKYINSSNEWIYIPNLNNENSTHVGRVRKKGSMFEWEIFNYETKEEYSFGFSMDIEKAKKFVETIVNNNLIAVGLVNPKWKIML